MLLGSATCTASVLAAEVNACMRRSIIQHHMSVGACRASIRVGCSARACVGGSCDRIHWWSARDGMLRGSVWASREFRNGARH